MRKSTAGRFPVDLQLADRGAGAVVARDLELDRGAIRRRQCDLQNLSLGATATSPDGLEKDGAASGDQAAIDGKPETYWDEADNQKLYRLRVQLPQPSRVVFLRLLGWQQHNYAPKDFEVLCDGKVVKQVANATYKNNWLEVALPPTDCAAVELKITGYYGASPAIRELEIYGKPPGR